MRRLERKRFDKLIERVVAALPAPIRGLLDETPLIVEDLPDPQVAQELGLSDDEILCGLHSGTPLTQRSFGEGHDHPEVIHLYREGVLEEAGGWEAGDAAVEEEIRVTILHEIGHHFGLEEDDLEELGYD
jgi:predicted Zn-dependent protease with MMP-like domain